MKIKKADIYKKSLHELIDKDGNPISGDENFDQSSQVKTAPSQKTDDYVQSALQKSLWFNAFSMMNGSIRNGGITANPNNDFNSDNNIETELNDDDYDSLDESLNNKVNKVLEDVLSKKGNYNSDLVDRTNEIGRAHV